MKTELLKIVKDFESGEIYESEAKELLFDLLGINQSVFIVCENDDYGRDILICCASSIEEAKIIKGNDWDRNIYEYDIYFNKLELL